MGEHDYTALMAMIEGQRRGTLNLIDVLENYEDIRVDGMAHTYLAALQRVLKSSVDMARDG